MKRILFTIALIFSSMLIINAQTTVSIGTVTSSLPGQIVTVPVVVSGCDGNNGGTAITGFEFHISYTSAVHYFGITNLYSGFSAGDCTFNGTGSQFIGLWTTPTFLPYNIPDGTVLFEIQFIARNGGLSPLAFMYTGVQSILLDLNFDIINGTVWNNGSVTMPTPPALTQWNSASAQSWATVGNWSNGLPGLTSNVIVSTGTMTIDNANFLCANLTVNQGAALTINTGITVNVPGNFILESNASNTRTGSLINNGTLNVTGNRIVKRWLSGGVNHFISTPLRLGTTINTLYSPLNSGWAYRWNEPTASWINMVQLTEPVQVGYGYVVNYIGPQTLSFNITDNPGFNAGNSYNPNTSYTSGNGWNLVGNPYLAALNWLGSGWTKTRIDNGIYFYNGTTYSSFVGGVGSNGGTQYIPAMQGFFVHANAASPNFVMPKASLVHNSQTYYKESIPNVISLTLEGNGYSDETVIRIEPASTVEFDSEYDAYKLLSMNEEVPQIYSVTTSGELSINSQPEQSNMSIPLSVKTGKSGSYSITAKDLSDFTVENRCYLEDLTNNTITDLSSAPVYTFISDAGVFDRFMLRIQKASGLNGAEEPGILVFASGKNIFISNGSGNIQVFSVSGQLVASGVVNNESMSQISLNHAPEGIYLVRVSNNSETFVKRVHAK